MLGGIGTIVGSVIQGEYNKKEAQKNRDFQERMSNTAIQRSVADASAAGISPSLVLGGASQPMGNSASISQPDIGGAMANTANKIIDSIQQDRRLDALERLQDERLDHDREMQDERLDHDRAMQQMRMSNSANAHKFMHHNYSRKELNSLWDDPSKVEI